MNVMHAPAYQWTVEEFEKLGETGFFHEDDRVELLNGEIIIMSPIGYRHAQAVTRLNNFFARRSRGRFDVSPQNPFNLDQRSQPQPDICLLDPRAGRLKRHPAPDMIYLVIEVADSSVQYDRGDKRPAYARNGVNEFWLLNLDDNVLEVYRTAEGGRFREESVFSGAQKVAPLAFPDLKVRVADLIPE